MCLNYLGNYYPKMSFMSTYESVIIQNCNWINDETNSYEMDPEKWFNYEKLWYLFG